MRAAAALAAAIWAASWTAAGCRGGLPGASARLDAGARDAAVEASVPSATATPPLTAAPPAEDAIPPTSGEDLSVRARHLLEAIAKDDASLSADILFPRDGWVATRDSSDPGREWDKRITAPFRRTVHALSRRRKDIARAQLVSFELGHSMVQVQPQRHGWKAALWTVAGSRLTFVVDGRTHTLPVHELAAWRGAWYVTRL